MQLNPSHIKTRDELLQSKKKLSVEVNTVWEPIPGSSQELALDTRCSHTLYHGARGPGKTITQLMRFRRNVGIGYGAYWRGIILDKEFKNLGDLVAQSKRFFSKFNDGAKFLSSASEYKWVWPTGEELLFRHAKRPGDYDQFHGHEYPFIGWNELTKQATSYLYDKMMSTNRSSFVPEKHTPKNPKTGAYLTHDGKPLPEIPLEVFSTTNPNGPGHNWVKRRFIDPASSGVVVKKEIPVFNPRTQQEEIVIKTQVAIFGSYRENIYLSPEYVAELESIDDPNLKRAWLYGDWDVVTGGAFDDVWHKHIHVKPRFYVPYSWRLDRSFDWGSTHPFSVGWWAEANGEEATLQNGDAFCPPPGTLVQLAEWYGTKEIGTNVGLKMSARDIADGIKDREIVMMANGWIQKQPLPGPADNQISNVNDVSVDTIEKMMADRGIRWTKSNKAPGSNAIGLQLMRDRLQNSCRGELPGLYFMDNCRASIAIIPNLPRDEDKPDEVDDSAETHAFDMVKYRVLAGNNHIATSLEISFAT
jgi:hypothetical protein